MFSNATFRSTTLSVAVPCTAYSWNPLDHDEVVLVPLCAEMHSRMRTPFVLLKANPLRVFPSPMQLMYCQLPLAVNSVVLPVHWLENPLAQLRATMPTKRT